MDLEFSALNTRPLHPIKSRGYIKCAETILEIRNESTFFEVINKSIIYKFFKDFTNHKKKTNRAVLSSHRALLNIFK